MDQKKQETTTIRTRDLGLASYLLASGLPFIGLKWDDEAQAEFLFRSPENADLATLSARYYSGTGVVPALGFKGAFDELRRRLLREKRERR